MKEHQRYICSNLEVVLYLHIPLLLCAGNRDMIQNEEPGAFSSPALPMPYFLLGMALWVQCVAILKEAGRVRGDGISAAIDGVHGHVLGLRFVQGLCCPPHQF